MKETMEMNKFVPEVKFNKNGYAICTQMLEMAQTQLWNDYHAKWGQFELSVSKDGKEIVTNVTVPTIPGAEEILNTAQKFYDFVNLKK